MDFQVRISRTQVRVAKSERRVGTVANWFTWRVTTTMAPQFRLDDRIQREWTLKAKAGIAMFKPLGLPLF